VLQFSAYSFHRNGNFKVILAAVRPGYDGKEKAFLRRLQAVHFRLSTYLTISRAIVFFSSSSATSHSSLSSRSSPFFGSTLSLRNSPIWNASLLIVSSLMPAFFA